MLCAEMRPSPLVVVAAVAAVAVAAVPVRKLPEAANWSERNNNGDLPKSSARLLQRLKPIEATQSNWQSLAGVLARSLAAPSQAGRQ